MLEDPVVFLSGGPLTAANLRMENNKILVDWAV